MSAEEVRARTSSSRSGWRDWFARTSGGSLEKTQLVAAEAWGLADRKGRVAASFDANLLAGPAIH